MSRRFVSSSPISWKPLPLRILPPHATAIAATALLTRDRRIRPTPKPLELPEPSRPPCSSSGRPHRDAGSGQPRHPALQCADKNAAVAVLITSPSPRLYKAVPSAPVLTSLPTSLPGPCPASQTSSRSSPFSGSSPWPPSPPAKISSSRAPPSLLPPPVDPHHSGEPPRSLAPSSSPPEYPARPRPSSVAAVAGVPLGPGLSGERVPTRRVRRVPLISPVGRTPPMVAGAAGEPRRGRPDLLFCGRRRAGEEEEREEREKGVGPARQRL
jgi:hypothetical protein